MKEDSDLILTHLKRRGLLLLQDPLLPSLAALVAGEPVKGSWWSHPRAHEIFAAAQRLDDRPDVACFKLVAGKVTFVHRNLWPALLSVATSGEPWQMRGLPAGARSLLARIEREGEVRSDSLPRGAADAARVLEQRLLVVAVEVHTESGAHAKNLICWRRWARRAGLRGRRIPVQSAKTLLEEAAAALSAPRTTPAGLPWPPRPAGSSPSRREPNRTER